MDCFDDHFEAKKAPIPWFVFLMLYNTTVEEMGNDTRPDWNELQKKGSRGVFSFIYGHHK